MTVRLSEEAMSEVGWTMVDHRQLILRSNLIAGDTVDPVADAHQITPLQEKLPDEIGEHVAFKPG